MSDQKGLDEWYLFGLKSSSGGDIARVTFRDGFVGVLQMNAGPTDPETVAIDYHRSNSCH